MPPRANEVLKGRVIMCKVVVMAAFLGLLAGCGLDSQGTCKDGWSSCGGDGCMPDGADCCPNGEGYCDSGKYCGTDNMCHTGGGGGGGNTCSAQGYAYTCINNTCSPGLWCCHNGCSGCGCR